MKQLGYTNLWLTGLVLAGLAGEAAGASTGALGERRLYECERTSQAPTIDGRLDDPCWKKAGATSRFVRVLRDVGKTPSVQTHVRMVYDDTHLYVGIRCDEPDPKQIKTTVFTPDSSAVCGDDSIEMFFHPNPASPDYYQLAANSQAVRYDGCVLDASWNADWQAAATVGADAWFLECRIALASFPERRRLWRFNICREFRSRPTIEFHAWSDTGGAFHSPSRFGHLIFSGSLAGLRRAYLIQAGALARATLDKQGRLDSQAAEVQGLRDGLPRKLSARFDKRLAAIAARRARLERRFAGRKELSLDEWRELDDGLAGLLADFQAVYWDVKFYVLIHD